jgi:endonuclease YncB( thermonuclease family)
MGKVIYSFKIDLNEVKVRKGIARPLVKFKNKKKYDRKKDVDFC